MSENLTPEVIAKIIAMELAAELTALSVHYTMPNDRTKVIGAKSTNGHWSYEKEAPHRWAIFDLRAKKFAGFGASLHNARQITFDRDHPVHTVPCQPRVLTFTVV